MSTATMPYIDTTGPGAAEVMRLSEGPLPQPGPQDVLIKVAYAGVNRPDVAQRAGHYAPPPGASPIMGLEVSGEVVAVGGDVTQWQVGDLVCALTPGGGYAAYCKAPAAHCLPIPAGLSLLEAAALPENFFTVWVNVFDTCRLQAGERLLVHGGSSGIGLTAIQLAKAFGAEVFTTVGNDEKVAFCQRVGAHHVFNYRTQDWVADIATLTQKQGVNVILDMVGGSYIEKNLRLLALEGRYCFIAFLQGGQAEVDFRPLMMKRQTITGSTLRARPDNQKAAIAQALRERVWPLLAAGTIKPVIHRVYPLAEVAAAHRLMESSAHIGKIMLAVG
ncbi:MAG: NAD(P)H-quinone oxidoreductase [Betaproteobacteria bacterium]|nr:NAD(P)H-quinone oxidoreductase [Betaproteobacteria bacterium]